MAKTIVVSGASGRLGRYLASSLLAHGYRVRSIVQSREHLLTLPAGTSPYLCDINNRKAVASACDGADAMVHLAAIVSEYKYTTERILRTNVVGTRTALDACRDSGVKRFVFASSLDVYGKARRDKLTESSQLKPSDRYGYSKMLAEDVVNEERGNVGCTILRFATAYGPGFEPSFFKLLRLIQAGKAYLIGSGENHLALVHVSDAARAIELALSRRSPPPTSVYNITDGGEHTQRYLFNLAAERLQVPRPTKQINAVVMNLMARSREIDVDELRFLTSNRIVDISRAAEELGFEPQVGIREGVAEAVSAFLERERHVAARLVQ